MALANQPAMIGNPAQSFPAPPNHAVPVDLRPRREVVEVSDIRGDRMTQADACAQLSSYVAVTLEKLDCSKELNNDTGKPMKPTWERVNRVLETNLNTQDAIRHVRYLNKETKSVLEKKSRLELPIQIQIERTKEWLTSSDGDPQNFQFTLAQLESKMARADSRSSPSRHRSHKKHSRHSSHHRRDKSKRGERAAVTLFFKRTPKPNVDCVRMLYDMQTGDARRQQAMMPAQFHPAQMGFQQPMGGQHQHQQQQQQPHPHEQQHHQNQQRNAPPPNQVPRAAGPHDPKHHGAGPMPGKQGPIISPKPNMPVKIVRGMDKPDMKGPPPKSKSISPSRHPKHAMQHKPSIIVVSNDSRGPKKYHPYHGSARSSMSSMHSEEPFWDDHSSSQSSVSADPIVFKLPNTGAGHRQGFPEEHGIAATRQHIKDPGFFDASPRRLHPEAQPRFLPSRPAPMAPVGESMAPFSNMPQPGPVPMPTFPGQNFRTPRMAPSDEDSEFEDDDYEDNMRPPVSSRRLPPRVIQRSVRILRSPEVRERINMDNIERGMQGMRLNDDRSPREARFRGEPLDYRRETEAPRYRREPSLPARFDRRPVSPDRRFTDRRQAAEDYMDRQERSRVRPDNPFRPLPRRDSSVMYRD